MTLTDAPQQAREPHVADVLAYQAPFLIEKLVKNCVVDSAEEGEELICEVKRYLVLADLDQDRVWNMYSLRVDEAWHQFILFTRQYIDFCHSLLRSIHPAQPE